MKTQEINPVEIIKSFGGIEKTDRFFNLPLYNHLMNCPDIEVYRAEFVTNNHLKFKDDAVRFAATNPNCNLFIHKDLVLCP